VVFLGFDLNGIAWRVRLGTWNGICGAAGLLRLKHRIPSMGGIMEDGQEAQIGYHPISTVCKYTSPG